MDLISEYGIIGVVVALFVFLLIIMVAIARLYRRATKEVAFVRTGFRGEQVVMDGGAMVLPVLHETMPVNMNTVRLAVERKNADALITLDRLRIDVKAEFYVRVRPDAGAIAMAAQTLGLRTMHPEALKDLVEGKFVDALRSVAAGMSMNELHEQRADFVQKVQQVSSSDLAMNGLELESVSLTGLDQTSIEHFNANNAFDAEGLTKLTEQIELRKKARNDIEQDTRVQMETKNLEADQKSFEIGRDNEFARLEQEREVEMRRAKQASEVAREQAERSREADAERLRAEAARVRFEVEAAGQRAINEAANILSMDQISLQTKMALLKVLPELIRESAKPMEAIESIKIVQVDGLTNGGGRGGSAHTSGNGGSSGNLASDAVSAALAYRAQAPVLDGLMKELGLDGNSLNGLVGGNALVTGEAPKPVARPQSPSDAPDTPKAPAAPTKKPAPEIPAQKTGE